MNFGMGNKLKDEINPTGHEEKWLSKNWWINTFEIIFWFFIIGGLINMIISENPIDFGLWATVSIILIIIHWIITKLKIKNLR